MKPDERTELARIEEQCSRFVITRTDTRWLCTHLRASDAEAADLRAKLAAARESLRFYAARTSYIRQPTPDGHHLHVPIIDDGGSIAAAALSAQAVEAQPDPLRCEHCGWVRTLDPSGNFYECAPCNRGATGDAAPTPPPGEVERLATALETLLGQCQQGCAYHGVVSVSDSAKAAVAEAESVLASTRSAAESAAAATEGE